MFARSVGWDCSFLAALPKRQVWGLPSFVVSAVLVSSVVGVLRWVRSTFGRFACKEVSLCSERFVSSVVQAVPVAFFAVLAVSGFSVSAASASLVR